MSKTETAGDIELLGKTVEYETVISEDATQPRIDVDIRGVRVVLPTNTEETPENLLRENANWVLEKKAKYDEYRKSAPDREFEEGERFPYFGKPRKVRVETVEKPHVTEEEIHLPKEKVEREGLEDVLKGFYRDEAHNFFDEKAKEYSDEMGVKHESVSVRNQRTRWGSCSAKKNLSFNWRLVMAPEDIGEYVVVHELAHLKEKNHTKRFWRIVREHMPEYKEKADWLEENSTELIFTEKDL